ncbi:hypothetical protein EXS70_01445 [Candidatus Peribacteria bacterium]|nr:hypothetical protein [Candidatus Peribacteria bacterium]
MPRRFLQQAIVLAYLAVTGGALIFTMLKVEFPFPEWVTHWSYGMMAPYQGDTSWNAEFLYQGQRPDGTWEAIDIDHYLPYMFAEQNVRTYLRVYSRYGDLEHRKKFLEFALLLLDRERARGKDYVSVRIFFDQWERSPAGYSYLHTPVFTTRELVTQAQ